MPWKALKRHWILEPFLKIVLRTNSDLKTWDFSDLTFRLSEVLNDITGIAKHYWMNVMIDLALAQSDRFICSGGVKNFLYVHSCVRFGSGAQLQLTLVNLTHHRPSSSCVQTWWSRLFSLVFVHSSWQYVWTFAGEIIGHLRHCASASQEG